MFFSTDFVLNYFLCCCFCVLYVFLFFFQNSLPAVALKSAVLLERLKAAYKAFTQGSFSESRQEFDFILRAVPLVVGETRAEGNELKEVRISRWMEGGAVRSHQAAGR